jgi:hypothetical protein
VRLSKYWLLALCIVVLGSIASAFAADDDKWNKIDLKPLIPPIVPLPPNAQVAPGSFDTTPAPGATSTPLYNTNTQRPEGTGGGLKITIPMKGN